MPKLPKGETQSALFTPAPSTDGSPCQDAEDVRAVLLGADAIAKSFLHLLRSATDLVACLRVVDVRHWPRLLCLLDDERLRAEVHQHLRAPKHLKLPCCA